MSEKPIYVTEPFLPPLEEYVAYLTGIWERKQLTNHGPLVCDLEKRLQEYHKLIMPVHCVANGGLGLQLILKALGIRGEVITTPFSYVATASCPLWEGCTVRFADIEPDYLTLDPAAVVAAITPRTEAILATHVFGNPCDVEAFQKIGEKYGIPIIYDAAHAFGVTYKGRSILEWGDASMVSLHATKLFHTVEGGFVVAKDPAVSAKIEWMRRFGHKGSEEFHGVGINAKMSELHAAMGLSMIGYMNSIHEMRRRVIETYLANLPTNLSTIPYRSNTKSNNSYFPVIFNNEKQLLVAEEKLYRENIFPKRYFYPPLNTLIKRDLDILNIELTMNISARILCLPLMAKQDMSYTTAVLACL